MFFGSILIMVCNYELFSKVTLEQEQMYDIVLSTEYCDPWNSQFRIQSLILNTYDLNSNGRMFLSLSLPTFTVARHNNGDYMFSLPFIIVAPFIGAAILFEGIDYFTSSEEERKEEQIFDTENGLLIIGGIIAGLYSLVNFGIDIPVTNHPHYGAVILKLNSDTFFYDDTNEDVSYGYLEPKIGFRYIYKNNFGIDLLAGYRFWSKSSNLSSKHPYFSIGLLIPLKKRKNLLF